MQMKILINLGSFLFKKSKICGCEIIFALHSKRQQSHQKNEGSRMISQHFDVCAYMWCVCVCMYTIHIPISGTKARK